MYILKGDSIRRDIVYLAHPRTASVATVLTLGGLGTVYEIGKPHTFEASQVPKDAIIFTTIRNPWDLFVSWWYKRSIQKSPFYGQSLANFIPQLVKSSPQYFKRNKLFYMAQEAHRILNYEQLQVQLDLLLVEVGYAPTDLVVANQSERRKTRDYRKHYNSPTREWVGEYFAPEIEKYRYQF